MKTPFLWGLGLGAAAAASVVMLMKPGKGSAEKALKSARKAVDQTMNRFGA